MNTTKGTHSGVRGAIPALWFLAVALWSVEAQGQEWSPGGYLTAYGGVNLMPDVAVSSDVNSFKGTDPGYRAGLVIGYDLRQWLGFEFETGFQNNSFENAGSTSFRAMPLLVNAVLRYPTPIRVVPFVGLGAGGAVCTLDNPQGADLNLAFGYQLSAGVEYQLAPQLRVGAAYKFFGISEQDYEIAGTKFTVSDGFSHFIGATVNWTF